MNYHYRPPRTFSLLFSRKKIQLRQSRPNFLSLNKINFTRTTLERNVIRVSKDGMDTVIDRINSSSFSRSSIRLERGSERTVSRIAAPNVQRLTSRPATSNVFLSRRFIARFLLQDRGQCARAPFINR